MEMIPATAMLTAPVAGTGIGVGCGFGGGLSGRCGLAVAAEGEAQLKGVMCSVADESCIGEFGLRVSETEEILVFINDGGESCDALLIRQLLRRCLQSLHRPE